MKTDIILCGVGGQGILSIASIIAQAAVKEGLYIKQAEVHGMSQRGGDVQSNLRISDKPIYSDLIPQGEADVIISLEPMEALRYLPYLSKTGFLVTNSTTFENIANYPNKEDIFAQIDKMPRKVVLDVDAIAKEAGSVRTANMVLLGASSTFIDWLDYSLLEQGIQDTFGRKGEAIVAMNLKALAAGKAVSESAR